MRPPLLDVLRADLAAAMRERDRAAVSLLRATLAAIENAEAPPADRHAVGEQPRRLLTDDEVAAIVGAEIAERTAAIEQYAAGGQHAAAESLRTEVDLLRRYA